MILGMGPMELIIILIVVLVIFFAKVIWDFIA